MRILQLTKFFAPFRGGIESVASELSTGLAAHGFRTDVLCANHAPGPTVRESLPDGTRITRVRSHGRLLSTSMAPAMLAEMLRIRRDHDLIHVHLPDPLTNLALFAARPTAKIVVHWHSDVVHQKLALAAYAPLQQWLLRRADAIIVTSEAYGAASPWLAPFRAKLHTVPIGIADIETAPAPGAVAAIRSRFEGRKLVFFLGRMVYYKGIEHLVEAAQHLPPDHVVVIGGSGPLLTSLKQRCSELGVESRVVFVGNLPAGDVEAYFAAADLFCLPSTQRSEAFGVVLLEAMRAGKPIVTTCIEGSGVPWVNAHGVSGLNVAVADSTALAAGIRKITADPDLSRRYGHGARSRYLEIFTADKMVDQVASLYRQLGESNGATAAAYLPHSAAR